MFRKSRWFVVLGVTALALGLFFGTAMADPGDGGDDADRGWRMHEQMDPEHYGQMIQRMTEMHGAEFTAEMLQRMNEDGGCHGAGQGMMGAGMMGAGMMNGAMQGQGYDGMVGGVMRGVRGMMEGFNSDGMMNGGFGNGHGMMGR